MNKPSWNWGAPVFNEELDSYKKQETAEEDYRERLHRLEERFEGFKRYYTDGEESEAGVGAAVVSGQQRQKVSLPRYESSFTAEIHAMRLACEMIRHTEEEEVVIFTDSICVMQSLKYNRANNPLIKKLKYQIDVNSEERMNNW